MKYQINGIDGVFEAEKLALAVLQDYCSKNESTFNELKEIFPDEVQGDKEYIKQKIGGNTGVFDTLVEAKDREDYFALLSPITIKDATIVVSNQWGERNLPLFIEKAEAVGYTISSVATEESSLATKHYTYIKTINNENSDQGFPIVSSCVVQTNGKYTLIFKLSHDGDGVMDQYYFYDIKTKIGGSNGSLKGLGITMVALGLGPNTVRATTIANNLKHLGYDKTMAVSRLKDIPNKVINLLDV